MPVLVEQYVVVGDQQAAMKAGELWRFGPKAFKGLYNVPSAVEIQQKADAETPMDEVLKSWVIGDNPSVHMKKMRALFDSGVSIVNIHSGQPDQARVIDFYGEHVLPTFRKPA
jgi:F420-dependent hydroxymycolic acid dehydrogenase